MLHVFLFTAPASSGLSTLSLHDALPIWYRGARWHRCDAHSWPVTSVVISPIGMQTIQLARPALRLDVIGAERAVQAELSARSEEHTSELQSQSNLVCRLLLEKKKQLPST